MTQYGSLSEALQPGERYDATLAICVLQALLANCWELLSAMRKNQKKFFREPVADVPHSWGISQSFVAVNTFLAPLTLERALEHLRNALSHPTYDQEGRYLSTGYTTLSDATGIVGKFRFIDSPWVKKGELWHEAFSKREANVSALITKFEEEQNARGVLSCHQEAGMFRVMKGDKLSIPVFIADLPLDSLLQLAQGLANHLSQPTNEHWDGQAIDRLVA